MCHVLKNRIIFEFLYVLLYDRLNIQAQRVE